MRLRRLHDFASAIASLSAGADHHGALARQIGVKGYHASGSSANLPYSAEPEPCG